MGQWSRGRDEAAFIDLVQIGQAEGRRKELYDALERVRGKGRVSNLFKAYGAFPELAMANFERLNVLLNKGYLSKKLKEGLMTALAEVNRCDYCVSFHATQMRDSGASDEEVDAALSMDPDRLGLSPKERALFEFGLRANGDPHSIPRSEIDALRSLGVTDAELVETLETVNTGNAFNLINGALNVGPDDFLDYKTGRGERWREGS